jgi:hypothetical protein
MGPWDHHVRAAAVDPPLDDRSPAAAPDAADERQSSALRQVSAGGDGEAAASYVNDAHALVAQPLAEPVEPQHARRAKRCERWLVDLEIAERIDTRTHVRGGMCQECAQSCRRTAGSIEVRVRKQGHLHTATSSNCASAIGPAREVACWDGATWQERT